MKKICFLVGNLNNSGGTERVTSLIASELSKKGYEISIISLVEGHDPYFNLAERIETYSLSATKVSFKKNYFRTILALRKFIKAKKIDTLIVVDSISCLFTIPALYNLQINHICWEHFNYYNNNQVKIRDFARKLAAVFCDKVVTLTKEDAQVWKEKLKFTKAEIIPIPNPRPYNINNPKPSRNNKIALAVGRLTPVKGFDLLIDIWAKICEHNSDWTLYIVGSGECEQELKNKCRSLGLDSRINFIPNTKNIEHYYRSASIYCLSSRFEGFPMVLLEAQAFGLPAVAFDCKTGPRELILESNSGYIVQGFNIESYSKKLITLMEHKDTYRIFSSNAINNSKQYHISNIIKLWISNL